MQAILKRLGVSGGRGLLGTRQGTVLVAAILAVMAAVVLLVFLSNYRQSAGGTASVTVLVADRIIPKGTSGDVVAGERLFKPVAIPEDRLKEGVLTDAAPMAGKVAVADIYPGQQITAAGFAAGADRVRGRLSGTQRAISVPLDGAHGLLGEIRAGDKVDVLAGFSVTNVTTGRGRPMVRTLVQDVLVLDVPQIDKVDSRTTSAITVRVDEKQAAALAFAADNGKVWFVLRPPAGADQSPTGSVADLESFMANTAPIEGARR